MTPWTLFSGVMIVSCAFTAGRQLEKGDVTMSIFGIAISIVWLVYFFFDTKGSGK